MEINPYVLDTRGLRIYTEMSNFFVYLERLCYLELAISICKSKSKRVHFFFYPNEKEFVTLLSVRENC